ncbi:MAG: [protein-PII] uridylyltransferase [Acidimicrobiia bacterium]
MRRGESLREARARLVDDGALRGSDFTRAYAALVDTEILSSFASVVVPGRVAVLAYGSYGRNELCPGSDVDVLLLHDGSLDTAAVSEALWYPLWDAGLVLGHATRTIKEAVDLAEQDLDTLTALLDVRRVAGDGTLADELVTRVRRSCARRGSNVVDALADAAEHRRERFGAVGEMLEPNLKEGEGGLRDVQALAWSGFALGPPGGLESLREHGALWPKDPVRLKRGADVLLDLRVALHRVTGTRSDVLALQEQDAVAELTGERNADAVMRRLAAATREVAWLGHDVWATVRVRNRGRGRGGRRPRVVGPGVRLVGGRIHAEDDAPIDTAFVLRLAATASELGTPLARATLERTRELAGARWDDEARTSFFALLRSGRGAVAVFEALDYTGVLVLLLPEWAAVHCLPQRNAYHRFTVDRHLVETAVETAELLAEQGFDGDVARACTNPDLLVLAALLHDIGKGTPGDHAAIGAETARCVAGRLGFTEAQVEALAWLVRNHLLLAETATRRDLSDEATIARFARAVGDTELLRALYVLTIADSRATGPAAWGTAKAALVTELFLKSEGLLERGEVLSSIARERREDLGRRVGAAAADAFLDAMPPSYALAFDGVAMVEHRELLDSGRFAVQWVSRGEQELECAVVSPDRTGLLAHVAGALTLVGFDIHDAAAYTRSDGRALEVYRGVDRFGRLARETERDAASDAIRRSIAGAENLEERVAERVVRYRASSKQRQRGPVEVIVDLEGSDFATIVEIHADDEIGLLARVAQTFSDRGLDVSTAKVATLGDRVVDVFYVRDAAGVKVTDPAELDGLRAALLARLGPHDDG